MEKDLTYPFCLTQEDFLTYHESLPVNKELVVVFGIHLEECESCRKRYEEFRNNLKEWNKNY